MGSFILRAATRLLAGLILVFAVYLLFRGHNAPGGGFSAVRLALRIDPLTFIAWGLLLAVGSGVPALLTGQPYLTGTWWTPASANGVLSIGSPLFFDMGVFLVVLGAILTLILQLEES